MYAFANLTCFMVNTVSRSTIGLHLFPSTASIFGTAYTHKSLCADKEQAGHPFLPYRIERRQLKPTEPPSGDGQPKTTDPAQPLMLHSPVPDKTFVKVPFWLSGEHDWDAEVLGTTDTEEAFIDILQDTETETHPETSLTSESSPNSTPSSLFTIPSPTSPSPSSDLDIVSQLPNSTVTVKEDSQDSDAFLQALIFAELILDVDGKEDAEQRSDKMRELSKEWEETYAKVRMVVEHPYHAGV